MSQPATIETSYRELVRKVGFGFHPDTPGAGFNALPQGVTAADVDAIVGDALDAGVDVYEVALDVLSGGRS